MMSISMVFLAVGFIMLPNVTTACQTILNYQYSANATITDSTFTGLTTTVGIFPLLSLLGFIAAGVIGGFLGVKLWQGNGSSKMSIGGFLLLGISLVFISLGLNIFPVLLDAVSSVVHGGGHGISSSFTGFSPIVLMSPMLVILGFLMAAVIGGYFGVRAGDADIG